MRMSESWWSLMNRVLCGCGGGREEGLTRRGFFLLVLLGFLTLTFGAFVFTILAFTFVCIAHLGKVVLLRAMDDVIVFSLLGLVVLKLIDAGVKLFSYYLSKRRI